MKNLLFAVFLFVVVCSVQAQRISLPVGEEAVTKYQWQNAGSLGNATIGFLRVKQDERPPSVGAISAHLSSVADVFGPMSQMQLRLGQTDKPDEEYFVQVDTYSGQGTNVASRMIFLSQPFKLVDGKIPATVVFPSETDIACQAPATGVEHSTVAVWAPDVRWVEEGFTFPGLSLDPTITRNGWGTNCWASALWGNGWIYFQGDRLSGRYLKWERSIDGPNVGQYITLWYDEGRTIGDRWDIGSGVWTPIAPNTSELKTSVKFGSATFAVATSGAVPGASYTLESVDFVGGSPTVVGTLSATDSGWVYWYLPVDPNKVSQFFNVRPARTGDPAPQKAVAKAGFSFP